MLAQGDQIHRFDGHRHTVSKVQFSPDGNRLISLGVQSGELILWDCRQRRLLGTLIQPTNIVDFAVTADGGRIAILFESGQLEFWDAELGSPREFCPVANVRRFRLSPTDPRVYLNDGDSKVVMWNRATGDRRVLFAGTAAVLEDISDDGLIMATAMGKSWVTWSVPKEIPLWTNALYDDGLDKDTASARLLPRGAGMLTLAHGRTPSVYDAQVGRWAEAWPNDSGINERNQVAMAGDVNMLATASYMHNVSLWDLRTFQLKDRLFGHRDEAWCVAISPDRRFLASGGQDKALLLWNNTLKPRTKELPGQFLSDPVFSPDGHLLALGRKGGQLSIFDLATATEIATLGVDEKPIQFSRDRSRLFALRGDFIRSYDSITWTLVGQQPLDFHMD